MQKMSEEDEDSAAQEQLRKIIGTREDTEEYTMLIKQLLFCEESL
jgi:hypothetical protein